ncbi:hypothetical protein [Lentilactobacillus sp. Marseille-Q4993]|uniref:hypothetical protein n=1 Tax=Lentilactobacillus sp. Marseille-Q4993 TaxID=3039492 RepID=UPI0024BC9D43|nr:hypothetical protein [Lentilactobacillus sp. Marseille-Q4993]
MKKIGRIKSFLGEFNNDPIGASIVVGFVIILLLLLHFFSWFSALAIAAVVGLFLYVAINMLVSLMTKTNNTK